MSNNLTVSAKNVNLPRTNIADMAAILLLVLTGSLRQKLIAVVSAGCVAADC